MADPVDVLFLAALYDEEEALAWVLTEEFQVRLSEATDAGGFSYRRGELPTSGEMPLAVALARPSYQGELATTLLVQRLKTELDPRLVAMSGICAGRRGKVFYGDVVFADQVFYADASKVVQQQDGTIPTFLGRSGYRVDDDHALGFADFSKAWVEEQRKLPRPTSWERQGLLLLNRLVEGEEDSSLPPIVKDKTFLAQYDHEVWPLLLKWMRKIEWLAQESLEPTWEGRLFLQRLLEDHRGEIPEDPLFNVHIGAMACLPNMAVVDNIFEALMKTRARDSLAIDMESHGTGRLAQGWERRFLVVKGVQDYSDRSKNDQFRDYAAKSAARCLVAFVQRSITPTAAAGAPFAVARRRESLAYAREAVEIYRRQVTTQPDAFLTDLADSLSNLSNRLSDLGRLEEARAAIQEAVAIYRRLAAVHPDTYQTSLEMVIKLSERLADPEPPIPICFLSLSVTNVRGFGPKQTLDMKTRDGKPARWVVLLGDNGAGKTTLLQCLEGMAALVTGQYDPKKHDVRWFLSPHHFCRHGETDYEVEASFHRGAYTGEISQAGSRRDYGLRSRDGQTPVLSTDTPTLQTNALIIAYGATRRMSSDSLNEASTLQPGLFNEEEPLQNAEERLIKLDYGLRRADATGRKQPRNVRRIALALMTRFLPGVTELRVSKKGKESGRYQVEFKTGSGWVPTSGLSLGYRTLMAWVLDLAISLCDKHPLSSRPLAEPAVVMVDEIDLHLHPKWQRAIIANLAKTFKNTQFIVTAHSPLVVQTAEEANVAVLRQEGDHVVIDNTQTTIQGWRIDQILTSDLFGIESSRPPSYERMVQERYQIMDRETMTDQDRARLAELDEALDRVPGGESAWERRAMEVIRKAAARLEKEDCG